MATSDFTVLDREPEVPQSFHQLGVLVLDGSASMGPDETVGGGLIEGRITKATAVNIAVRELLGRLLASNNRKDFSMAVVTFDHRARLHTPVTRVCDDGGTTINDNADYDPMNQHGGGTDLATALKEAQAIAERFIEEAPPDSVDHSAVIVVMSDGMSKSDPRPIADDIKRNPKLQICAALFALKNDTRPEVQEARQTLQDIVSSPTQYKTVWDAESLRKFFIASVASGRQVQIV